MTFSGVAKLHGMSPESRHEAGLIVVLAALSYTLVDGCRHCGCDDDGNAKFAQAIALARQASWRSRTDSAVSPTNS
ncbi:hypothetical protein LMG24235_08237 [Paraburkholderia sabiae]|nr:hypothetical protein LMG24235_08237 [Paraburkholderia sabiae]